MTEQEAFEAIVYSPPYEKNINKYDSGSAWPEQYRDYSVQFGWLMWQACAERNVLNIERIRELIGYLISMASLNDEQMAKQFADELEELLPKINPVLPGETE